MDVVGLLRLLMSILFVLALPLFLISTDLRVLVTDTGFILKGFQDNQVQTVTGLSDAQLRQVANAFVSYFQGPPGELQVDVVLNGQARPLFNDREVQHMVDVQALIQGFFRLQIVAGAIILLRLAQALVLERSTFALGRDVLIGLALVVLIVGVVAALSFVDFDDLWIRFHEVAFRNDLWQLDPRTDYLIMLFPEPFWYAATLRYAVMLVGETVVLAAVGFVLVRLGLRNR